jgi:hypothetical protein
LRGYYGEESEEGEEGEEGQKVEKEVVRRRPGGAISSARVPAIFPAKWRALEVRIFIFSASQR